MQLTYFSTVWLQDRSIAIMSVLFYSRYGVLNEEFPASGKSEGFGFLLTKVSVHKLSRHRLPPQTTIVCIHPISVVP